MVIITEELYHIEYNCFMYIDTHAHLNFEAFKDDWQEVVRKAQVDGVKKIIIPGSDLETSKRSVEIADKTEGLYAAVGFHPHHCKELRDFNKVIDRLEQLANNKKVVAIGECGLDYHVYQKTKYASTALSTSQKNLQKKVFGKQIQLAKSLNLPMVIHNREAQKDILDVMDHFCKSDGKYPRGVFHCISGGVKYLKKVLEKGFYIGVDGNVTYSDEVKALVKEAPLDRLLIETDSPYLLPEPLRNNLTDRLRNQPTNVKIVAESVSEIKKINIEKVENQTTKNANELFNI